MPRVTRIGAIALTLLLACSLPSLAQNKWAEKQTFPIGGQGGWDYLTVDPATHRLFVPRGTHTLVIDADSGKTLGDIPGQKIAHGVAIAPEAGRGFISDGGGEGAIVIFDLKTFAVLGKITAQPDADGIIYDPSLKRVLVVSGDKGVLMTFNPNIDPATGKIDAPIDLGGSPEFLASDGAGKIYVNLMDKNEVAVVEMKTRKVVARWPVAPGGAPVGMSIDTKKKQLYIGCRKPQKLIVMSLTDGKVLSALPIGDGVDATKADGGEIFASCRDGSLAVAQETSPGKFEIVQMVKTRTGARTMGIDTATHRIYLPTAEYETGSTGKPVTKPNSFMIIVVARE
ncbi:YncE family protein [Terriglobus albidus]|uniref:YncE family protein n=1 Tax=Terriglobus albidus TaxID=1592106 RepID=UPI0021DFC33D|nr:YncE family protein [Terriglobus albidus]